MPSQCLIGGISFLKLSEAGFGYTGQGSVIKCEGCGQEILVDQLRQYDGHVMDPAEARFHNDNCIFVRCKTKSPSTATHEEGSGDVNGICSSPTQESLSQHSADGSRGFSREQIHRNETNFPTSIDPQERYVYDDSEDIDAEVERIESQNEDKRKQCERNPGHFGCTPIKYVTQDHLSGPARHPYVVQLLQTFSLLTVRIIIKLTNVGRSDHSSNIVGTGFVSFRGSGETQKMTTTHEDNGVNGFRNTNDCSNDMFNNNNDSFIRIETNKHLVSHGQDPGNVTVEFFYDDPCRSNVKTLDVVSILSGQNNGEYGSVLVCRSPDVTLVHQVDQCKQQILNLIANIPDDVKEFLSKKVFIIHHLHGREQHLSHGDCVQVKYKLVADEVNKKSKLHKLSSTDSENVPDSLKMLLYTADTCPGTAGAPVITFSKLSPGGQFVLDVQMHNGLNKQHELGCTILKACRPDDLVSTYPPKHDIKADGQQKTISDVLPNSTSKLRTSPLPHPSYPAYTTKQKRLDSYIGWCHNDIHEPDYLAQVGFFYAGYSDCVRCFQCGLGLRSWKPGDHVLSEHSKYRSDCPFLQNLLSSGTQNYLNKIPQV
ncbi:hypothetical protein Btru_061099 [Bulinus truncatus]|nr:hypothetical protein Btru_061099 [Bulinus truncatus]